ncbi:MAG: hypothetical protein K8J08_11610 [Thermoanaerobaculia bacterium]|nr:hypothetical protein [Thermoanaerobaculia bacterium]
MSWYPSAVIRLAASFALLGLWLLLLFIGWTLGGAIHLLLAGALVLFPWREGRGTHGETGE